MSELSTYEKIRANIGADGKLPHTFTLEKKKLPNQLAFTPGAEDGMGRFPLEATEEEQVVKKVVQLLKKFCKAPRRQYLTDMEIILTEHRALSVIDPVLNRFISSRRGIDAKNILGAGFRIVQASSSTELTKIGISLFGLFDLGDMDEAKKIITTLALYDDYTLYAVIAVSAWTNGNHVIFQIAQNVDGWGKIHAVEHLEPESEEIREWILRKGCLNSVMDAYLGLSCATKGDLISALRQESMDDELFDSTAIIIDALLAEGPTGGISVYEHAREALTRFLDHAQQHAHTVEHLWRIQNLQDWAEHADVDYRDELRTQSAAITQKPPWREKIISTVQKHDDNFEIFCAINAAARLNIDISAELLDLVTAEPLKYCWYIPHVTKNQDMVSRIINLYETILPFEHMAQGMGDHILSDELHREFQCLQVLLFELEAYPLQGVQLIKTALNSPVVHSRGTACGTLSGWVKAQGKPLADISPELYSEVARIYQIEVNDQTRETMKELLAKE